MPDSNFHPDYSCFHNGTQYGVSDPEKPDEVRKFVNQMVSCVLGENGPKIPLMNVSQEAREIRIKLYEVQATNKNIFDPANLAPSALTENQCLHVESNITENLAVIHFMSTAYSRIRDRTSPLAGILNEISVWVNESASFPKALKNAPFSNEHNGINITTIQASGDYQTYVLDYGIRTDCNFDLIFDQIDSFCRNIMSLVAHIEFQSVYNTLRSQKSTGQSSDSSNEILGIISANFNTGNETHSLVGEAVGWNQQKFNQVKKMQRMACIDNNLVFFTRADTVHNLFANRQPSNDYFSALQTAPTIDGLTIAMDGLQNIWVMVGSFSYVQDGTLNGIHVDTSNDQVIADEFAFDPRSTTMTVPSNAPKLSVYIYWDKIAKELRFRIILISGARCSNPKGIILVKNAVMFP